MKLMAETLAKYQLDETTDKKEEIKMSLEEAIKIIQVNNIGRLFCLIEFWKNVKKTTNLLNFFHDYTKISCYKSKF